MANISDVFNKLLESHESAPIRGPRWHVPQDGFIKEAYTINSSIMKLAQFLLSIRQAYLSTARAPRHASSLSSRQPDRRYFTDKERDEIDFEAKTMIRQYMQVISNLEDAEKTRVVIEKKTRDKRNQSLGKWIRDLRRGEEIDEEEEKSKWIALHREGVLWLLKNRLEKLSEIQREQQETRLMREVEKNKSILENVAFDKSQGLAIGNAALQASKAAQVEAQAKAYKRSQAAAAATAALEDDEGKDIEQKLSADQLRIFAKENQDMVKFYEDTLDQIRSAERSLIEISEMQNRIVMDIAAQTDHIDQLMADSVQTAQNMEAGNKQLKQAAQRSSPARYVFQASIGFCAFLILADMLS
ncbi:Syntaxin-18 [Arthrobotrys entomopaga]|nr:Syntaxin-18 [Arthrobotrys entomopaga]